jgi:hypothetical protein
MWSYNGAIMTIKTKGLQDVICNPLISLVRPAGFEPAAYGFEVGFRAKTMDKDRQQKVN